MPKPHRCPVKGCVVQVPYYKLACPPHWFKLPAYLRNEVTEAYKDRFVDPARHMTAVQVALAWYRNNP